MPSNLFSVPYQLLPLALLQNFRSRTGVCAVACGQVAWIVFISLILSIHSDSLHGQELNASDGDSLDLFGVSSSISNNNTVIGAVWDDDNGADAGAAYLFRQVNSGSGLVTESAKLTASDGAANDFFGVSVSVSGDHGLVGASLDDDNGDGSGSAYLFRSLSTASGIVNESAKLTASDGAQDDGFGYAVSLHGSMGLIGARGDDDNGAARGSAYVFRGLDSATGAVQESVKLIASESTTDFGEEVSIHGNMGIVGSRTLLNSFSAYLFRDLDTATGVINETARLQANGEVSIHGNIGIVGNSVFRGLDTATGNVAPTATLNSLDGVNLGLAVLSGSVAVAQSGGSAYVFSGLDTKSGSITETVKLTNSDGEAGFGASIGFEGDAFVVGAFDGVPSVRERAYTGTVSSMTTLDAGDASRAIFGLSFESRTDWIVGETTSENHVSLSDGDSAEVLSDGKAVFIGKNAGSDDNSLTIAGTIEANEVIVGAEGNSGNHLILEATATNMIDELFLFRGNQLSFEGEFTSFSALDSQLGSTDLFYAEGSITRLITSDNFEDFLWTSFDSNSGFTTFIAVPEPASGSLMLFALAGFFAKRRKSN